MEKVESILNDKSSMDRISENAYWLVSNSYNRDNAKRELLTSYFSSIMIDPE